MSNNKTCTAWNTDLLREEGFDLSPCQRCGTRGAVHADNRLCGACYRALLDEARKEVFVAALCSGGDWAEVAALVRPLRLGNCPDVIDDPRPAARQWGATYASASRRLVRRHS